MQNKTLIAETSALCRLQEVLPAGLVIKPTTQSHEKQLAGLWHASYPPEIATDLETAEQEMVQMFAGEFGPYWPEASPGIFSESKLVAAICTVVRAPWEATPTCPFVIDLIVDPAMRRRGLATCLWLECARVVREGGFEHIALRVLAENTPALELYRKLGFEVWDGKLYAPS